jgi:hypothetical protein
LTRADSRRITRRARIEASKTDFPTGPTAADDSAISVNCQEAFEVLVFEDLDGFDGSHPLPGFDGGA